jgi:hypothetical protein
MDLNLEAIAIACVLECKRQHVGLDRLAGLVTAYAYADEHRYRLPAEGDVLHLVGIIEPETLGRYRLTPVTFAQAGSTPADAAEVPGATARLFGYLDADVDPYDFVRALLSIHPFADGNGRVGFVLFNWLAQTLDDPRPLPEFDW